MVSLSFLVDMGLLLLCTKGELKCFLQSAADDSEAKSNELTGAVEELHKLLKEAGEGKLQREECSWAPWRTSML